MKAKVKPLPPPTSPQALVDEARDNFHHWRHKSVTAPTSKERQHAAGLAHAWETTLADRKAKLR